MPWEYEPEGDESSWGEGFDLTPEQELDDPFSDYPEAAGASLWEEHEVHDDPYAKETYEEICREDCDADDDASLLDRANCYSSCSYY